MPRMRDQGFATHLAAVVVVVVAAVALVPAVVALLVLLGQIVVGSLLQQVLGWGLVKLVPGIVPGTVGLVPELIDQSQEEQQQQQQRVFPPVPVLLDSCSGRLPVENPEQ